LWLLQLAQLVTGVSVSHSGKIGNSAEPSLPSGIFPDTTGKYSRKNLPVRREIRS
jgi:hypothetical protein